MKQRGKLEEGRVRSEERERVEEGWWVGEKHSGWYCSAALLCSRVLLLGVREQAECHEREGDVIEARAGHVARARASDVVSGDEGR
jgi:hypothetical protein